MDVSQRDSAGCSFDFATHPSNSFSLRWVGRRPLLILHVGFTPPGLNQPLL